MKEAFRICSVRIADEPRTLHAPKHLLRYSHASPIVRRRARYTEDSSYQFKVFRESSVAEQNSEKLYKAEYVGSGTFIISKPKRSKLKRRQSALKNVRRGSRK